VIVGIRPEDIQDAALSPDAPPDRRLLGKVLVREALGSEIVVHMSVDTPPASSDEVRELASEAAEVRRPAVSEDGPVTSTFVGRFGARSRVAVGDEIVAAVDTRSLHFFDPATGLGIHDQPPTEGAHP
jgi:multiple sugar transport system ATP-binding protein